ncbi:unnamed protein product [Lactuca saligna]|uniref:DC1 domain-containing protein n=1 Tax=Lactuca saligna TaxID=75948 RepID=A0AA35ZF50_LACSI|nr:unnamed protein product [Lactuca saligna]
MFVVIKEEEGGFCYFYENLEYNILFNACIDCCLVEIALKTEADAIKEAITIKIEHEGHPQHILTLQLRLAAFRCDACNTYKDEGLFYECDSCDFWIHKTCASLSSTIHLPTIITHLQWSISFQKNSLNLHIIVNFAEYTSDGMTGCIIVPTVDILPISIDEDENGLLHFPMSYELTDRLKRQHYEKMTQYDDDDDEKIVIKHQNWSHEHPLILHVQPQANNMSGCSDPIEVCFRCVRPLSLPYYTCKDGCNSFSLHKYCAELPLKLQHPLQPDHSLDLIHTCPQNLYDRYNGCGSFGNTLLYKCETCEFNLDVNCALLPRTIKHESHKHPFIQVIDHEPLCNACNVWCDHISYACKACSFILDIIVQ